MMHFITDVKQFKYVLMSNTGIKKDKMGYTRMGVT